MLDFKPTEDIISMSEFRNTLADCVARTAETHRPIILTQNGRATSVFLSAAQWEKITEKLYNAELYEDILVSEGESERGEMYTQDEVKRMTDEVIKKATKPSRAKKYAQKLTKKNKHQRLVDAYKEAKEVANDPNAPTCTDTDKIEEFMLA